MYGIKRQFNIFKEIRETKKLPNFADSETFFCKVMLMLSDSYNSLTFLEIFSRVCCRFSVVQQLALRFGFCLLIMETRPIMQRFLR